MVMMYVHCRFRAGIKDLEVMMQNVITTAFETVTTVEQGVELLDAFQHLSSREVSLLLHFTSIMKAIVSEVIVMIVTSQN